MSLAGRWQSDDNGEPFWSENPDYGDDEALEERLDRADERFVSRNEYRDEEDLATMRGIVVGTCGAVVGLKGDYVVVSVTSAPIDQTPPQITFTDVSEGTGPKLLKAGIDPRGRRRRAA